MTKLIVHGFNLVSFKASKHLRASFSFLQEICYARNITFSISYETTRCCSALPCSPPSSLFRGSTWKLSTRVCKHTINVFSYSQKIKLQKCAKLWWCRQNFPQYLGVFVPEHAPQEWSMAAKPSRCSQQSCFASTSLAVCAPGIEELERALILKVKH